jgi:hypothetical protein
MLTELLHMAIHSNIESQSWWLPQYKMRLHEWVQAHESGQIMIHA